MSDPLLPKPPEDEDELAEQEIQDVEDDAEPDVLPGAPGDAPEETEAAGRAAAPEGFRTPQPGERLTAEELADELD